MKKPFLFLLLLGQVTLSAQHGLLDTDFDTDGIKLADLIGGEDFAGAEVQADGKIVAVGTYPLGLESQLLVMRFLPNGSHDMAFNGGTGYQAIDFDTTNDNVNIGEDVLIQPDGNIVVVGWSRIGAGDDMTIARLLPDGTLDSTFHSDGKFSFNLGVGSPHEDCSAVAMDGSGNYYMGGTHHNGTAANSFIVLKLDPAGNLEPSFAGSGVDTFAVTVGGEALRDLILLQDGRILCGGIGNLILPDSDFGLLMLKPDGNPDSTFSTDGRLATHVLGIRDGAMTLAQQADGKIVAGGYAGGEISRDLALVRYTLTGALDLSFDGDGIATYDLDMEGKEEIINGIVMQPDGKILLAGATTESAETISFVGRYHADGTPDTTFGTDGFTVTDVALFNDEARGIALQEDLKVVTVGWANGKGFVARYLSGLVLSSPDPQGNAPLTLYPNPVQDNATLKCQLAQPGPVEIHLTDLAGRVLHTFRTEAHMAAGTHEFALHLPEGLAAGEYLVVMACTQGNLAMKLLKI